MVSLNPQLVGITNNTFISGTLTSIGLFLDDFGNPIPGATVIAFQSQPQDSNLSTPLFQGIVNSDGSFNLNVPAAGTYQVQLAGNGISKVRSVFFNDLPIVNISGLTVITDRTLDIVSAVLGPVMTPGGVPIVGAEIQLFSGNDLSLLTPLGDPAFTGGDGTFRVFGSPGSNLQVVFEATGYQRMIRNVSI